jgi:hypothetical protein
VVLVAFPGAGKVKPSRVKLVDVDDEMGAEEGARI